ncbi:MAG: hypothetical protein ACKO0M_15070 [Cyanobium sp.]
MTFRGSLQELTAVLEPLGIPCRWEHRGAFALCVFDDGGSNPKRNRWPESGELTPVGDPGPRGDLETRLAALLTRLAKC